MAQTSPLTLCFYPIILKNFKTFSKNFHKKTAPNIFQAKTGKEFLVVNEAWSGKNWHTFSHAEMVIWHFLRFSFDQTLRSPVCFQAPIICSFYTYGSDKNFYCRCETSRRLHQVQPFGRLQPGIKSQACENIICKQLHMLKLKKGPMCV